MSGLINFTDHIDKANTYKNQANEFFKQGRYKKAISYYARVIAYTRGLPGSTRGLSGVSEMAAKNQSESISEEQEEIATELEAVVEVNTATCYLKLNQPMDALEHCAKALTVKPNHWKALLRKGEAQIMMSNYDVANQTLKDALANTTDPQSMIAIQKEQKRLQTLKKEHREMSLPTGFLNNTKKKDNVVDEQK